MRTTAKAPLVYELTEAPPVDEAEDAEALLAAVADPEPLLVRDALEEELAPAVTAIASAVALRVPHCWF